MDISKINIFGKIYNFKDSQARESISENTQNITNNSQAITNTNEELKTARESINSVDEKATKSDEKIGLINKAIAVLQNKLSAMKLTFVSATKPTDESAVLWINPDETESFSVPEINDNAINVVDTWSSNKISEELKILSDKIVNLETKTQSVSDEDAIEYLGGNSDE